jgi:hypothetical protein
MHYKDATGIDALGLPAPSLRFGTSGDNQPIGVQLGFAVVRQVHCPASGFLA